MKPYEIRSVILGFALILISSEETSFLALIGFVFYHSRSISEI